MITLGSKSGLKNIATVFSGTFLAQLINALSLLLVARFFFNPESFGIAAVYLAIFSFLAIIPTLRFNHGIQVTSDEIQSKKLVDWCILTSILVSIFFFILIIIFSSQILSFFKLNGLKTFIYLIPLHILFYGINETFLTYSNRLQRFKLIALNRTLNAIISAITVIILGAFFVNNPLGLILSPIIGLLFSNYILLRSLKWRISNSFLEFSSYKKVVIRFKKFAVLGLPSDLLNALTNQLPIFMLSYLAFNVNEVGNYNMSNRLLGMPIALIGVSVGEVFRQRAIVEKRESSNYIKAFKNTFSLLFLGGLIPSLTLIFFGRELFILFLGIEWATAGSYSEILGVLYFFRLVCSPLSYSFYINEKQAEHFILNIYLLLSNFLLFNYFHKIGLLDLLKVFTLNYSLVYLYYLIRSWQFSKNK